jgi:hypothetical protein
MRKLLVLAAVLAAGAAGFAAAVPASASASVTPTVHASAVTPAAAGAVELCDHESTVLCMAGHDGAGGLITAKPFATGVAEAVKITPDTNECTNGRVTANCPFTVGSGLNTKYFNDFIVQIQNANNMLFYRSDGAHVLEQATGDGQLWVEGNGHPLGNQPPSTMPFVNINDSNAIGSAVGACTNGNGADLLELSLSIAPSAADCSWLIASQV